MEPIKRGQIAETARKVGISSQFMWSIVRGHKKPSAAVAVLLEKETGIDRRAWLYPDEFKNPLLSRAKGGNPN